MDNMDHREIGQQLDLFMFSPLSPGQPIWLPKGMVLYNLLLNRMKQLNEENGCEEVRTPILWKSGLYRTSGHLDHYAKNMFFATDGPGRDEKDENHHCLKPMNCPGHMEIFRSKQWSYRDLPVRYAEYGPLHRNEVSGAIGGLTRCRAFCQDDAHIFVSPQILQAEIKRLLVMIHRVYGNWFNMNYRCTLSTRPDAYLGEVKVWDNAEAALEDALGDNGIPFDIAHKEGAFYGPKIDFIVTDSLNREWQTATIQLDFQLPQRFGCTYTDEKDQERTPIVIHRAIYGSFERFIGILLEHTQGNLPFWLAPISVCVLPISDKLFEYADEINMKLRAIGVRSDVDKNNHTLQQKIAIGFEKKYPFMVIVGGVEATARSVTLKTKDGQETMPLESFFPRMLELVSK
jgi:threonyl-tRNA synthetase